MGCSALTLLDGPEGGEPMDLLGSCPDNIPEITLGASFPLGVLGGRKALRGPKMFLCEVSGRNLRH